MDNAWKLFNNLCEIILSALIHNMIAFQLFVCGEISLLNIKLAKGNASGAFKVFLVCYTKKKETACIDMSLYVLHFIDMKRNTSFHCVVYSSVYCNQFR